MKLIKHFGLLSLSIAASLSLSMTNAQAQNTNTPHVDKRQAHQQQRINQGVQSGELTAREASRLQHGQAHVQAVEDKAKADGVVTNQERARMAHAQDVQSRRIYRQKHDGQRDLNHDGKMDRPRQ